MVEAFYQDDEYSRLMPGKKDYVSVGKGSKGRVHEQKAYTFWWIGMIAEVDIHNGDLKIKFMHPHGPSKSFSRPSRDDYCWVPIVNIITHQSTNNQIWAHTILLSIVT